MWTKTDKLFLLKGKSTATSISEFRFGILKFLVTIIVKLSHIISEIRKVNSDVKDGGRFVVVYSMRIATKVAQIIISMDSKIVLLLFSSFSLKNESIWILMRKSSYVVFA